MLDPQRRRANLNSIRLTQFSPWSCGESTTMLMLRLQSLSLVPGEMAESCVPDASSIYCFIVDWRIEQCEFCYNKYWLLDLRQSEKRCCYVRKPARESWAVVRIRRKLGMSSLKCAKWGYEFSYMFIIGIIRNEPHTVAHTQATKDLATLKILFTIYSPPIWLK